MCKKVYNENKNATVEELREAYKNLRLSVLGDDEASDKKYVMRGVDFCGFPKNWFYKYETIYPIKQVEFEGGQYSCLNNTDEFLTSLYGNYMGYPKKIGVGHTAYIEIDDNERNIIKNIITERS
jgi:phosphorylcholine metabolism protein LicD